MLFTSNCSSVSSVEQRLEQPCKYSGRVSDTRAQFQGKCRIPSNSYINLRKVYHRVAEDMLGAFRVVCERHPPNVLRSDSCRKTTGATRVDDNTFVQTSPGDSL